jgi:addiction module HigA family antidote
MADLSPVHPGEILSEEFLKPVELSAYRVAQATGLAQTRLSQIIHGKRSVTPDTALRLGKALGTTPECWLNLQAFYDLRTVQARGETAEDVEPLLPA